MVRTLFVTCCILLAAPASAIEIKTPPGSQPESVTVAPNGAVIIGSFNSPKIFRAEKNSTTADVFIDASAESPNETFLGVLADGRTNTLWACQIHGKPSPGLKSSLRGFDLRTGAPKSRWDIPGETSLCNDVAVAPDGSLYVTDTFTGIIWHVKSDGSSGKLSIEDRALVGVDGITFLSGTLYVNNVFSNNFYRIPLRADGSADAPVEIYWDRLTKSPDGMRAAGNRMFLAENSGGIVSLMTVSGEKSSIVNLATGLKDPTGVEPMGDELWIAQRFADRVISIPLPK